MKIKTGEPGVVLACKYCDRYVTRGYRQSVVCETCAGVLAEGRRTAFLEFADFCERRAARLVGSGVQAVQQKKVLEVIGEELRRVVRTEEEE